MTLTILFATSWAASLACLGAYAYLTKTGRLDVYNRTNAVAALPLAIAAAVAGAYPAALLSGFYGVVACVAVWRERRPQEPTGDPIYMDVPGSGSPLKEQVIVCAGNYSEAEVWARENGRTYHEWIYPHPGGRELLGRSALDHVVVGTFFDRPDVEEVLDIIRRNDIKGGRR